MWILDPLNDGKSRLSLIDSMGTDLTIVNDARTSFNKVTNSLTPKDIKLIKYLITHKHFSTLRGVVFKFKVKCPLFVCRQWYKHAVSSSCTEEQRQWNEACISEDQIITTYYGKKLSIKELFNQVSENKAYRPYLKSANDKGEIVKNRVKDIWLTGHTDVYLVKSKLGFTVETTDNHRFLTSDGYKELRELRAGDLVMMNGINAYRSKQWLLDNYINRDITLPELADETGYNYNTLRKWLKIHELHLSREEVTSRTISRHGVYGKGETKETNPKIKERAENYSKSQKGIPKKIKGEDHWEWKGNSASRNAGHYRARKAISKTECDYCPDTITSSKLDIHHKDNNSLNNDPSNLEVVCRKHHSMLHGKEALLIAHPVEIESITYIGKKDVYDLEMEGYSNFVVSQFIVHNSLRYVDITDENEFYVPESFRQQSSDNRQATDGELDEKSNLIAKSIYESQCDSSYQAYSKLLELGVGRELARGVLVPSVYTSFTWTASLQSVLYFIDLRKGHGAQSEIVKYAEAIEQLITPIVPHTIDFWQANNAID